MPRSEHFLYRPKPSPWPKALITVSCQVTWEQQTSDERRQTAALASWHVAVCVPSTGGYTVGRVASGATAESFWQGLKEALERSKGCTVLCCNTRECAAVLGLWERLENGTIKPAGKTARQRGSNRGDVLLLPAEGALPDVGEAQSVDTDIVRNMPDDMGPARQGIYRSDGRGSKRPSGVMILQDPPIVLDLQLENCPYRATWLDVANYGVDSAADFGTDGEAAKRAALWFIGASGVLKSISDCGWQNTAGSQSLHLYRRTYLEASILSHTEPNASALERSALFGGRCECFKIGRINGRSHLLDIRSMYPYICANMDVPVRLCRVVERPTITEACDYARDRFVIADCYIQTDEPNYPYREGESVVYPVGRYRTCLAGVELAHAARTGPLRGVRRIAIYETDRAIGRFATHLYSLRNEADARGNRQQSAYIKRLMVSVVGKFAQQERTWMDCPQGECPYEWGEWYERRGQGELSRYRSIAGYVQREEVGGWSHGAVPAITIAVTAAGRSRLLAAIVAAGWENVYYCDTDAIICNDYGRENLSRTDWIRPGEWGYLQPVESSDDCTIYGDKYYTIGARTRQSGQRREGANAADNRGNCYDMPWIGQSLRHRERPADWRERTERTRTAGRYDRVREGGGIVKPLELWEF